MRVIAQYTKSRGKVSKGTTVVRIKTNATGAWREVLGEDTTFEGALTKAWAKLGLTVEQANALIDG